MSEQQQDPIIHLQLPVSAVNVILQALGEIPTKLGMPIITHLAPQVQRQINAAEQAITPADVAASNDESKSKFEQALEEKMIADLKKPTRRRRS